VSGVALALGALALNRLLVGVFYDDGLYAGLALALARGEGFVHPHLPGTPACIHYPPLYPLLLAPLFGLLPLDAAALGARLVNLALAAGAAGLIAWHVTDRAFLGERAPAWLAAVPVAAGAVAIPVLATQAVLFSEPLFALLLAGAVVAADRERPLLAGVAAALALLTRTIGIAAVGGIGLYLVLRGASRRAVLRAVVPGAAAAVAWGLWVLTHRQGIDPALALNYGSYAEVLRQTGLGALGTSAWSLPRPLLGVLTVGWVPWGPVRLVLGVATAAVGIYGLARVARRSSIGLVLLGYVAILATWPYPADRFLWAVLPWLALGWAAGVAALLARPRLRGATALVAGVTVLGFAMYQARGIAGRWWEGAARAVSVNFAELLPRLRELPAGAVLASDDEALVWLYTGHPAVPFYLYGYDGAAEVEPDPAIQRAYLERKGTTHVVLASPASPSARQLRRLIEAYPGWLSPIHRWPGGRWVYELHREG
jgi:hypothetical protein